MRDHVRAPDAHRGSGCRQARALRAAYDIARCRIEGASGLQIRFRDSTNPAVACPCSQGAPTVETDVIIRGLVREDLCRDVCGVIAGEVVHPIVELRSPAIQRGEERIREIPIRRWKVRRRTETADDRRGSGAVHQTAIRIEVETWACIPCIHTCCHVRGE